MISPKVDDKVEKDKLHEVWGMHAETENFIQCFGGKTLSKKNT
jgi:hypothetical protein